MCFSRYQIIGLLLVFLGLPFLVWGNWSQGKSSLVELVFTPTELAYSQGVAEEVIPSAPQEGRIVSLSAPAFLRLGDEGVLNLVLSPTIADSEQQTVDIYTSHNLVARAWLELGEMNLSPSGEILTPLRPGTPAVFTWQIRSLKSGMKEGTLWLHLEFVPLEGQGQNVTRQRILLAAPHFQLNIHSLIGLAGLPARVIGGLVVTIGLVLLFEPALSAIISNLFKKENIHKEPTEN